MSNAAVGRARSRWATKAIGAGARAAALTLAMALAGCGGARAALPPTTPSSAATPATTTTAAPPDSNLTVVGVRPGVLQPPFYPQLMVTRVTCGSAPSGGRYVRIDLPPGTTGTPAGSVLTKPTAVIAVPGAAVLVDPRFLTKVLYVEAMKSLDTSTGVFVLTLHNLAATGADGLTVVVGNVQVNGDYQCPDADLPYPGN